MWSVKQTERLRRQG